MDGATYLAHALAHFKLIKSRADQALARTPDPALFTRIDAVSNSLAVLVKHVAGNARSRWTDFLTTDGEKPDRRRDAEFEIERTDTRERLLASWEAGWGALFQALGSLAPEDLSRQVTIRGEPHTVFAAIERQKEHYAYHVGQIVFLAKHLAGPAWTSQSIPLGGSAAYEAESRTRWASRPPERPERA